APARTVQTAGRARPPLHRRRDRVTLSRAGQSRHRPRLRARPEDGALTSLMIRTSETRVAVGHAADVHIRIAADPAPAHIKRVALRGGAIVVCLQSAKLVLRFGSALTLARLLTPEDFGLVGMVTVVIGFLGLFTDAGLSMATVHQSSVTHEQMSTLFWINLLVGVTLAAIAVALTPTMVAFYHEPRLLWIGVASAAAFVFNALAAQHHALLQRGLRFLALATVELLALVASIAAAIALALVGGGVWALVAMSVSLAIFTAAGCWIVSG